MMVRRQVLITALLALAVPSRAQQPPIRVAAAANIKPALDMIVTEFSLQTGLTIDLVYGASGNFRRQIAQGAPFDLFLSADEETAEALSREGQTLDAGAIYAIGRIVLFGARNAPFTPDVDLAGLGKALKDGKITRFAIANPEHAPYGRAAEQALKRAGLWDEIKPRLVIGENVAQAAQFAASGSTQGGIFALSLATAPQVSAAGTHVVIPAEAHQQLAQRMVLLKRAGAPARQFYEHLRQEPARSIFQRHGFALPGEKG